MFLELRREVKALRKQVENLEQLIETQNQLIKIITKETIRQADETVNQVKREVYNNRECIRETFDGVRRNGIAIQNVQANILSNGNTIQDLSEKISIMNHGYMEGGMQAIIGDSNSVDQSIDAQKPHS